MKKHTAAAIVAMIIMVLSLSACRSGNSGIKDPADLEGKSVGVLRGSVSAGYIERFDPSLTLQAYDTVSSLKEALKKGSVDCAIVGEEAAEEMTGFFSGLEALDEPYSDIDYSIAVSAENRQMVEKLNLTIAALSRSGKLSDIIVAERDINSGGGYDRDTDAATVTVAVSPDFFPYAYNTADGELAGIEIDLVREICGELGLTAEFLPVESDKLLYMAQSGKCSFAVGRIPSDLDSEGVTMTDRYFNLKQYIIVRK